MAFKTRDYAKGNEFVGAGSFKPVTAPPSGPRRPSPTEVGGASEIVQRGTAYGGVRQADGAGDASKVHQKRYDMTTFKPGLKEGA